MEKFAKILNWNLHPDHLLLKTEEEIRSSNLVNESPYQSISMYRIVDQELFNLLQPFFNFKVSENCCFYQIISEGFPVHIDQRRDIVYNYILNPGGPDVYTVWYDKDKTTEIYKIKIPSKTWHRLDVSTNHTIVGPQNTKRIALSVFQEKT